MRSLTIKDEVSIRKSDKITTHFISNCSRLGWKTVTIDEESINFVINFHFARPAKEDDFFRGGGIKWKWHWKRWGFESGRFIPNGPPWHEDIWIVPYWSIVLPLTVLSAWLLLSKPRTPKQKPAESTATIGA